MAQMCHHGKRIGIDLTEVPAPKMAALEEVTIEQYVDGPRDDPQTIKKTKIKLRQAGAVLQANEMIGKWLGMWQSKLEVSGPEGGPILTGDVTDEERKKALAALFAKFKAKAEAA
jgi:hypothetical protein